MVQRLKRPEVKNSASHKEVYRGVLLKFDFQKDPLGDLEVHIQLSHTELAEALISMPRESAELVQMMDSSPLPSTKLLAMVEVLIELEKIGVSWIPDGVDDAQAP